MSVMTQSSVKAHPWNEAAFRHLLYIFVRIVLEHPAHYTSLLVDVLYKSTQWHWRKQCGKICKLCSYTQS